MALQDSIVSSKYHDKMNVPSLDRKLSTISTSSNQTEKSYYSHISSQSMESQSSSVLLDSNYTGMGRQSIQSSVLQYMKSHENEFNVNELYQQRNSNLYSATDDINNRDQASQLPNVTDDYSQINSKNTTDDITFNNFRDSESDVSDLESGSDDQSSVYGDASDDDTYESQKIDEDLLLPPSPPRSPPREIDPDKLYALYEFSGPDPSHCTLSKDEPVYLINDSDNYWWLIKKVDKDERIEYNRRHKYRNSYEEQDIDNEEDGKVGFVPAECLETFGERLARLNCFKNEELEKDSRDNFINNQYSSISHSDTSHDEENTYEKSSVSLHQIEESLFERSSRTKGKTVKFENLSTIEVDTDDQEDSDFDFQSHYFNFASNELEHPRSEETNSDIINEAWADEKPLIVKKSERTSQEKNKCDKDSNSKPKNTNTKSQYYPQLYSSFEIPSPLNSQRHVSEEEIISGKIRRNVLFEQLSKVSSDLQEFTFEQEEEA